MLRPRTSDRAELTAAVAESLLRVAYGLQHQLDAEVARLGLTPAAARALYRLDPDNPSPARDLAQLLLCDRSNITGLVDKLEQAGLVQRRVAPTDRRVRTLVVTEAGRAVQEQMWQAFTRCAAILGPLSDDRLATLYELLGTVAGEMAGEIESQAC